MTYYPDLSPYEFTSGFSGLINIGWLDSSRPFEKGAVDPAIVSEIGELCRKPVNLSRGHHLCPFCPMELVRSALGKSSELDPLERPFGNGEIHVSAGGLYWVYACPALVYHYIAIHEYLPPHEFLDAVKLLIDQRQ